MCHEFFVTDVSYSHLSNKRDVTLTDFGKFHPAQNKNSPCMFIDFIKKVCSKVGSMPGVQGQNKPLLGSANTVQCQVKVK